MKKRALSLLLAFVMTLGLAVPAFAAEAPFDELEAQDMDLAAPAEPEAPVPVEEEEPVAEPAANDEPAPASYDEPAPASLTAGDGDVYQIGDDTALGELFAEAAKSPDVMFNAKLTATINTTTIKKLASGKVTLDMGGFDITRTGSGTTAFWVGDNSGSGTTASLTLTGSGSVSNPEPYSSSISMLIYVDKGGTLTLAEGGNVSVKANGQCLAIDAVNGSQVNINGGTVESAEVTAVQAIGSHVNMEGGAVKGEKAAAVLVVKGSTMTLGGGDLSTNCGNAVIQVGMQEDSAVNTLTMTGGTLTNPFDGVDAQGYTGGDILAYGQSSTATISGGTVHNVTVSNEGTVTVKEGATINATRGFACLARENGKLNIEGGTVTSTGVAVGTNGKDAAKPATITISGGTVTGTVGAYIPSGTLEVKGGSLVGEAGIVARQGTVTISSGTVVGTSSNGSGVVGDATSAEGGERYNTDYGAIVVDKATKGYGDVTVTISGGTINGAANGRVLVYAKDGKSTELPADSDPFKINGGYYSHSVKEFAKADSCVYEIYAPGDEAYPLPYSYSKSSGNLETLKTTAKNIAHAMGQVTDLQNNKVYTYYVLNSSVNGGTIEITSESKFEGLAFAGDKVTFTIKPNGTDGEIKSVTVTDAAGKNVDSTGAEGSYSFTMPCSDASITAVCSEKVGDLDVAVEPPKAEGGINQDVESKLSGDSYTEATLKDLSVLPSAEANDEVYEDGMKAAEGLNQNVVKTELEKVLEDAGDELQPDDEIILRVETTINTTVTGYENDGDDVVLTLEIKPEAHIIATTKEHEKDYKVGENAVKMGDIENFTITKPVTLTIPVPSKFVEGSNVWIKHIKDNGRSYYYKSSVVESKVTFTNPNGFSEFQICSKLDAEAKIGEVPYPTLQDAVYAVAESNKSGTITLVKEPASQGDVYLPGGNYSITIDASALAGSAETTLEGLTFKAASGYTYSPSEVADSKLTVTVSPSYHGGGGGGGTTAVDKSALKAAIAAAQALKGEEYTTDSWSALEAALAAAKTVDDNAAATQAQVNAALAALTTARSGLVKKGDEPGPGGEILPPAGGTGWRWVEDEQTYYYFKDGKRVGDYWIGFADGGSAWANNWYYADANGRLLTGFQYLDDLKGGKAWYMLQTDNTNGTMGKMLTGWQWTYITTVGTGYFSPKYGSQGACTYTTQWGEYNAAAGLWGDGQTHTGK